MEEALVESPAVQHVVQKAARKLSLQRALIQELVQRGQGRAPMSFATQSASHGYTTVSKLLTIEQKLDEISGRLRAFDGMAQRARAQHGGLRAARGDGSNSNRCGRATTRDPDIKTARRIRVGSSREARWLRGRRSAAQGGARDAQHDDERIEGDAGAHLRNERGHMREISATCVNLALGSVMDLHHYVPGTPPLTYLYTV